MLARVLALLIAVSSVAYARPGVPIVLVSTDEGFKTALDDALVPAGMDVIVVGDVVAPSIAELSAQSRQLADRERAAATVWLLPASSGATLVTYDRQVDRLLVRELPYPSPLSATQAAEAARMVRTMLSALRVSTDEPQQSITKTALVAPVPPEPWLAASVGVGGWFPAPAQDTALAGTAALVWRPRALGAAVEAAFASSAGVMTDAFVGELRDIVVAAEARYGVELRPDIHVSPTLGIAVHSLRLRGELTQGGSTESARYDPAIRVGGTALYGLPRGIDVGLSVSADTLLLRQEYVAANEQILLVPRLQLLTHLVVGIRL